MTYRNLRRALALCLCLMLAACGLGVAATAEGAPKKATLMVYMCGTNLESQNGQGTRTISDMLASRFDTENVNVVVLLGGSKSWFSGYDTSDLTVIELGGRRPRIADTLPLTSMGAPETLTTFLAYCKEHYPAESYDLMLWDHGGGPTLGICQDELFANDTMDMFELSQALGDSPFADRGLDMIIFHACLMGSAEIAVRLAPYAHYIVASEDSIYGMGFDWMTDMAGDASPLDTAIRMADSSFAANGEIIANQNASEINGWAVVDLTATDALVQAMDAFFSNVDVDLNNSTFTTMSNQRRDATTFGLGSSGGSQDYDLVDLGDLVVRYSEMDPEGAQAVIEALQAAVPYSKLSRESCYGLTVYHPFLNKSQMEPRMSVYNSLGFSRSYTSYIQSFSAILTGTPLADWQNLHTDGVEASKDVRTLFSLSLSEDQVAHFGAASLAVLLKGEDDTYTFTFANNNTAMDEQGRLTGEFSGTALYAVDAADGSALSPELDYILTADGAYLVPATLVKHGEEGEEDTVESALIVCAREEGGKALKPGSVQLWNEAMQAYTPIAGTTLEDYDAVTFTRTSRTEARDENGVLKAFSEWDVAATEDWSADIDGRWSLVLVNDTLDTTTLYATFQVTDSQNNTYSSEPVAVKVNASSAAETRVLYDDANLVMINSMSVVPGSGSVALSASLTNIAEQEAVIRLENLTVNGNALSATTEVIGSGENYGLVNGEEQMLYLSLSADDLTDIDAMTDITFDLVLEDAATGDILGTVPVEVTLNLDITGIKD